MKKTLHTLSAILVTLFACQAGMAQDATKARSEVKKEAVEANKAGTVEKGDVKLDGAAPAKSKATRASVKKEAAAANKAGTIEVGDKPPAADTGKSTKARADVKKEGAAANKAGTIEKGEGK